MSSVDFNIVGIGASAGGLAAFESFFSGMPKDKDPGMAFVLVQHLDPNHKSLLTEIIRRYTRMKVFEVEDGMSVSINCTYIIPPNRDMKLSNGRLELLDPTLPHGQRLPIDFFFQSLAMDQHEKAICIILSGAGSDGAQGLRSIKAEGGLAIAQSINTSDYDSMPKSAIATGLVDYELPPSEMPARLIAYSTHNMITSHHEDNLTETEVSSISMKEIFTLLQKQTNHDFSQYKPNTTQRRIERRMAVNQNKDIDTYTEFLKSNPVEIEALFQDLLIGVTNFFRDSEAFKKLEEQVIPKIFEGKQNGSVIRIWSIGCSTGEEAYSLAILIQEHIELLNQNFKIQIFATDINSLAISTARSGVYPVSISMDITPERLAKYFQLEPGEKSYRISKSIREMLVFSEQDIVRDPPFSKIDLISCRNLMIYLSAEVQKRLIRLFHFSLSPKGFLFLGTSETLGEYSVLFETLDRQLKIYRRKDDMQGLQSASMRRMFKPYLIQDTSQTTMPIKIQTPDKLPLRELTEQALLKQIAPSSALVNSQGDILYLHGRTGMYLEPNVGEVGIINIIKMARQGLKEDLSNALYKCSMTKEIVRVPNLQVKTNGDFTGVNLTVLHVPTDPNNSNQLLFIVILEDTIAFNKIEKNLTTEKNEKTNPSVNVDTRILQLTQELESKENFLQNTTEKLETTNEELKSSNEEMQSVNEELQSTNEELETAKEEMQSVNEELSTVNAELQSRVQELSRTNNDMNNLLSGTGIATLFVDFQLCILRFTPNATKIINLIHGDIGRPVGHIVSNFVNYNQLLEDTQSVIDSLIPKEIEVQTLDEKYYAMRILPYRTIDNGIEGAVITFFDITDTKIAREKIAVLLEEKKLLLKEVHHRIKNNMNTVAGLMYLQIETLTDASAITALNDARNRVISMMVLYDKIYLSSNFSDISFNEYFAPLVDEIINNFPNKYNVTVEKHISDFKIDSIRCSSLGIIINELITNIMKYAFNKKKSGIIILSSTVINNQITISIRDNGVGIPESIQIGNSKGFGLQLVEMMAKQMHGKIRIERENGTNFILEFDL